MSDRCEPPEHLRGVDGWHWVQPPVGNPHLARWHAAERLDVEPLWTSTHHVYSGTPRYAVREWGWRYIAPVATPAEVETLRARVERLEGALQNMMGAFNTPLRRRRMPGDFYDEAIASAGAALEDRT